MPKDNFSSFLLRMALLVSAASADKSFVKNFLTRLSPLALFGTSLLRLDERSLQTACLNGLHDEVFLDDVFLKFLVEAQYVGKALEVFYEQRVGAADNDAVSALQVGFSD
jgi:hypothetical protein